MSSLEVVAAWFLKYCPGKTDTNSGENPRPAPATSVGLGNKVK